MMAQENGRHPLLKESLIDFIRRYDSRDATRIESAAREALLRKDYDGYREQAAYFVAAYISTNSKMYKAQLRGSMERLAKEEKGVPRITYVKDEDEYTPISEVDRINNALSSMGAALRMIRAIKQ